MLGVELGEPAGVGLRGDDEREVLVQEHAHQQRRCVVRVDRAVVDELTDADAFHHHVVVALDQLGLVDQITGFGVIPARCRVVFPPDQPGGPCQLEHTGGRQFVVDLHLEASPRRAVRAEFGTADDDHQLGRVDVEVVPHRRRGRGEAARRRRQRGDGPLAVGSLVVDGSFRGDLLAGLGGQFGHIQLDVTEPAGEVHLDRRGGGGRLRLDVAEPKQQISHLVGGIRCHAGLFDGADDRVVLPHQPGATGPTDQRVRQADSLRPRRLGPHRVTTASSADLASP